MLASECDDPEMMTVAAETEDGTHVLVCFNPGESPRSLRIAGLSEDVRIRIESEAIQTIIIRSKNPSNP